MSGNSGANGRGAGPGGKPAASKPAPGKPANGKGGAGKPGAAGKPGGGPKAPPKPRLAVIVDGIALPDDEARELWVRFSQHMDAHQGDMAGFAAREGFASVTPEHRAGQAVLVITRRA